MPVITKAHEFGVDDLYVDLTEVVGQPIYLKCEGFNFAGSVKLKAAREMVEQCEASGLLGPGSTLVESSSGNMGIALSIIAASKGYRFVCVTDVRANAATIRAMEAFGTEVHVITEPLAVGGFLGARLRRVEDLCAANPEYAWLNQYRNPGNWMAHYRTTAPQIAKEFPDLDVLFVGSGTTGTLMGCARYFNEHRPEVTIVAIDSVGSVTFGGPPLRRNIPGLGTSVKPSLLDESHVDSIVHVPELTTIQACRLLMKHGFAFGGSTGTVVAGALAWLRKNRTDDVLVTVAIAPDLGDRYLDTVYSDDWVFEFYQTGPLPDFEPENERFVESIDIRNRSRSTVQ